MSKMYARPTLHPFRWMAVGALIAFTHIFSPIHEAGHVLGVWLAGGRVVHFGWDKMYYKGPTTIFLLVAGFAMSFVVALVAARIFARRWKIRTSMFCLGFAAMQPIIAVFSTDYHDLYLEFGYTAVTLTRILTLSVLVVFWPLWIDWVTREYGLWLKRYQMRREIEALALSREDPAKRFRRHMYGPK